MVVVVVAVVVVDWEQPMNAAVVHAGFDRIRTSKRLRSGARSARHIWPRVWVWVWSEEYCRSWAKWSRTSSSWSMSWLDIPQQRTGSRLEVKQHAFRR